LYRALFFLFLSHKPVILLQQIIQ